MKGQLSKTKILATIGPATSSAIDLEKIINAGASALRLNFSHGSFEDFEKLFEVINDICIKKSLPIPILVDLQGPKIRIGELKEPQYEIKKGETIEITNEVIVGTKDKVSTSYKELINDANIGNIILVDDGLLKFEVIEKKKKSLVCKIIEGGILKPRKGMNLPGMKLSTPSITEKDLINLEFAIKHRVDFIALSFVREAKDIKDLKNWLKKRGKDIPVIAKIEKEEAVHNFDSILEAADGIMVARGDLGVELAPQMVPILQKNIIKNCNAVGKVVITATQMLESMISNPIPTRAEASDVANAVLDGTDVVMLSGETSVGKHPDVTVKIMNDILARTELQTDLRKPIEYCVPLTLQENLMDAIGQGVANTSKQLQAAAIVVFTHFGKKARLISKFRPECPVFAFTNSFDKMNQLNLFYGIKPFFYDGMDEEEEAIKFATKVLKKGKLVKKGDLLIFTGGVPNYINGRRHWLQFSVL
ncbi:MAG: pyruvate kinase [Melioribacteraceae bacterium]|nr:pyruvate kinase [Melioribacteraceae bacterium]